MISHLGKKHRTTATGKNEQAACCAPDQFTILSHSSAAFSPSFGSDAAGSARDGAVDVRQVGVVPCVVPGTDLQGRSSVGLLANSSAIQSNGLSKSQTQTRSAEGREFLRLTLLMPVPFPAIRCCWSFKVCNQTGFECTHWPLGDVIGPLVR